MFLNFDFLGKFRGSHRVPAILNRVRGGSVRGVLVPPCDPEAQTTFSPPPRARSTVFYDGARALWGLRRSLIFARGECQQGADISSQPLPESGLRAWQVLGGSRLRFLVCAGCAKGAWGRPKKDDWSTRVAAREQPEAPRLQFSSWGSHKLLNPTQSPCSERRLLWMGPIGRWLSSR